MHPHLLTPSHTCCRTVGLELIYGRYPGGFPRVGFARRLDPSRVPRRTRRGGTGRGDVISDAESEFWNESNKTSKTDILTRSKGLVFEFPN